LGSFDRFISGCGCNLKAICGASTLKRKLQLDG
jgi:hypothetical protein